MYSYIRKTRFTKAGSLIFKKKRHNIIINEKPQRIQSTVGSLTTRIHTQTHLLSGAGERQRVFIHRAKGACTRRRVENFRTAVQSAPTASALLHSYICIIRTCLRALAKPVAPRLFPARRKAGAQG